MSTESPGLLADLKRLHEILLGKVMLEVLPEDGRITQIRMQTVRPRLAFLPMRMRYLEGLTLLRTLPRSQARRVVLLVPDTLEGYRVGWEGLFQGARDFMVTRGTPPQRLKGGLASRLRQVAQLLAVDDLDRRAFQGVPDSAPPDDEAEAAGRPWIVLPETRHLPEAASWLQTLPIEAQVVLRVPEGPRLLRAAQEGLGRLVQRPVRTLVSGDRLVPGHVHLFSDAEHLSVEEAGGHPVVRLVPARGAPGGWAAYRDTFVQLRASGRPLQILLADAEDSDPEAFLCGDGRLNHTVRYLDAPLSGVPVREPWAMSMAGSIQPGVQEAA